MERLMPIDVGEKLINLFFPSSFFDVNGTFLTMGGIRFDKEVV